jgi:leader peptidase (prepilin peptidase)/N-methyltransferase
LNIPFYPPFDHPLWLLPAFLLGACIGSFLNVAIYRIPLGLSVNEPNRSFCPVCKTPIPMRLNVPLISWLWLRGKCASCHAPITFRYFAVELLTALLFVALWCWYPPQVAVFLWVYAALLVVITFIDAEHLIIPTSMTWAGSVLGLAAAAVWPRLAGMAGDPDPSWKEGLVRSAMGWAVCFGGLWLVVELGKLAFGKKVVKFDEPADWKLHETEDDDGALEFIIGDEAIGWWDLFARKTDRLEIEAGEIRENGISLGGGRLVLRQDTVEYPDGRVTRYEEIQSLDGNATRAVIPREAMGMGDVHLLAMIGAFFGWECGFFSLFAACILALLAAVIGRIGFGIRLPFGPFLAAGSLVWAFGGWMLWQWYLRMLGL